MKKKQTPIAEKQVEEFNYQQSIAKRLTELKGFKEKTEIEIQGAEQFIQQKGAELNIILGGIRELERVTELSQQVTG